jgi:rubrerythrin
MDSTRRRLIRILQAAYSGEMAAAYAYRGHWKSLTRFSEKEMIYIIEDEEWEHRRQLRRMLNHLEAGPQPFREIVMWCVGRTIGLACYVTGWYMPMYFAGLVESGNVKEYEMAALYAESLGLKSFEDELRRMAETERKHERFFMKTVGRHRLSAVMRAVFGWG